MEMYKNLYVVSILFFGLFLSLIICSGASAADVNGINHYSSNLSSINELKSINSSSSTVKIVTVSQNLSYKNTSTNNITVLPAYYDLRTLGKLTPVKDQGFAGTCWAFAAIGSLESNLLPYETWNFSENHMKNLLSNTYPWGFDRSFDESGCWEQATAYLTRYSGPVTSAQDPYNDNSGTSPSGLKAVKHVQETILIEARNSTGTLNNYQLKRALMKYGAIYSLITYDDSYFNPMTYGYYYNGTTDVNHAICIVGWDDNYDKNNFLNGAPANGAFIIRNSWGSYWGDNGYFYVSYYDKYLGNSDKNVIFMNAEPTSNYDNIYQYDPLGAVGYYGYDSNVGWFSNVFKAKNNELLKASSFYVLKANSAYELYVYLDPKGKNPKSGTLALIKKGIISTAGYKTIVLDKYIPILKGHRFSVVVKLTTPNYNLPITVEYPILFYSSKATANPGESYVSMDGVSWDDMSTVITNANVCLKAFTSSVANLSITKKISVIHPVVNSIVSFNIKVTNNGPGEALNVTVKDNLPQGLTILSYITNYGIYDSKTGIWNIGVLPNGAVANMLIKCIVKITGEFTNKAEVSSSTYDPILNNNVAIVYVNAVNRQANNGDSNQGSVPMQNTGTNFTPLIIGLIIVICGFFVTRKN